MAAFSTHRPLGSGSMRELLDALSDFVLRISCDQAIEFVNASCLRRLGYHEDELLGRSIFDLIHPECHEVCMSALQRLLAGEDVGVHEIMFRTKSGEAVSIEGRMDVQRSGGLPTAMQGVFRELTAPRTREASTQRLREQRKLFHSVFSILRGNTSTSRGEFLELATRKVAQALQVSRASVWLFDKGREHIVCAQLFADGQSLGPVDIKLARADHPAYFDATESKLPVRADDAHTHLATHSFSEGYLTPLGITSMLDAPIRLGEHLAGVLCCEHTGPRRHWTNDEEEFMLAVAAIILLFLEREARVAAERELNELNQQLERMVEIRTQKLAQSEERLRYVLTTAPTALYSCAPTGDFRTYYVSPNIESLLGYPVQCYLDDASFWTNRIHPEDRERVLGELGRTLEAGHCAFEYRFRLPDGRYRWIRDESVVMKDDHGNPTEIVGSCVDIHDRRMAEDAAKAAATDVARLIETANAPIFGKDVHHTVNEWNRCAERLTGYSKPEVLGRKLTDFVEPQHRDAIRMVLDGALSGVETANFEFPIVTKDGRHLLLLLNASTRRAACGAITGMVGVGQDITERREAERRSLRAQRLESIGTLAGGVAHDINNALAPILLATGLFRRRHPESRELLDVMESSARRGASMVQQLLTFAKGVDGKRVIVRADELMRELEQIVFSTFPKNITARFMCADRLPPVLGDSTQLHQVLLNLCVNARDAMPNGGQLVVEAQRTRITADDTRTLGDCPPGEYVLWSVSDSGTGIPEELLDRIFDPFFSTKSPEQGTGLGLSTAMGIIRSHGGSMRVHSRRGEGSTFSVYVPATSKPERACEPTSIAARFRGNGERVLVVDDELAVRDVCRQILQALGLRVLTAKDGATALAMLADPSNEIAGVITDLHMPGMDGIELTRRIKQAHPALGVILSSGRVDRADAAELPALGIAAQLDKPFTIESLSNALEALLASDYVAR